MAMFGSANSGPSSSSVPACLLLLYKSLPFVAPDSVLHGRHVRDRDIDWLCRQLFQVVVPVVVIHLLNGELRVVLAGDDRERQKRIEMLWGHVGLQFVMNCAN